MYKLQEILESTLQELLKSGESDESFNEFDVRIASMIPDLTDSAAQLILASIRKKASSELKHRRRYQKQFESRLMKHWKKPLDALALFINLAREVGTDFNSEYRNEAEKENDAVFEALTRLHARSCQLSLAILTLLQSGFADDAHARWRLLHEIAVFSCFIRQGGQELAGRYLHHEIVQQYKLACEHQKYVNRINEGTILQEEFDNLKLRHDQLVNKYGKAFKNDYGWAASILRNDKPTIRQIEEYVGLDHMRPYYRMASDNEHPNSHGVHFRLGLGRWQRDVLLAGPSNMGLADPGHSTAISLNQVTTTLLATRSTFDCLVVIKILSELTDEIGKEFLKAHQGAEAIYMAESRKR